jgi:L-glutamine:2-deoxy-scyllo-inosose/3-amino-2,3-dideoxy-scyllo-inosose aminotransferase
MADLDAILEIASRENLVVIEDCAHGHGGQWKGRGLGSWGHVGSFSFQQSKTMTSGEGGICITNDEETAARLYKLKHIGYGSFNKQGQAATGPDADLFCHNYRATEFQAVILRDQLQALPGRMATYQDGAARLEELLAGVPNVRVQARGRQATAQSYYRWTLIFDDELAEVPLAIVQKTLEAEGVALGVTYGPIYQHILWNAAEHTYRKPAGGCPVTDTVAAQRTLVLPHYWLGADAGTLEAIGTAIAKVGCNAEALRAAYQAGTLVVE